jgi:flagellar protein FlbD
MIQLTRLNHTRIALNSDLIKYVEQAPDTVITLIHGEKLVVRENTEQVIELVRQFRRSILAGMENSAQLTCSPLVNGSLNCCTESELKPAGEAKEGNRG